MNFWNAHDRIIDHGAKETAVIIELPANKAIYHNHGQNKKAMGRTGVNVGSVIREAELLAERFIGLGYQVVTVRPQGKASAANVEELIGITQRTNQHVRDAIMLVWRHRMLLKIK